MESLALVVSIIIFAISAFSPAAIISYYYGLYIVSLLFAILAVCGGIWWLRVITTAARYIGTISVLIGLIIAYLSIAAVRHAS